jgi:hypothetical protein
MKEGCVVFDGKDAEVREHISRLHAHLIPYGPVPRLGVAFMQNTYYRILPASQWMRCEVYGYDGKAIGFFTSAREEGSLLKALGFWTFLKLGLGILVAIAKSPKRFFVVMELLRRSPPKDKIGAVELLSFGVEEKLRNLVDSVTGKRVSTLLFENCMSAWKAAGVQMVFCRVKRDNVPVLLFYKNYGAEIISHADDPTSYEIIFQLERWSARS